MCYCSKKRVMYEEKLEIGQSRFILLKSPHAVVWSVGWVCTVRDKKPGKDSIPNPSFVNMFSLAEMRLDLPCR